MHRAELRHYHLPAFPLYPPFGQILAQTPQISLGGQDCHPQETGAHTGDISAEMLADIGAKFVIIGHSERRANHGETDAIIAQKTTPRGGQGCARLCAWGKLWRNAQTRKPSLPASCKPACLTAQPPRILSSLTSRFGLSAQATRRTMMISPDARVYSCKALADAIRRTRGGRASRVIRRVNERGQRWTDSPFARC